MPSGSLSTSLLPLGARGSGLLRGGMSPSTCLGTARAVCCTAVLVTSQRRPHSSCSGREGRIVQTVGGLSERPRHVDQAPAPVAVSWHAFAIFPQHVQGIGGDLADARANRKRRVPSSALHRTNKIQPASFVLVSTFRLPNRRSEVATFATSRRRSTGC